MRGTCGGEGRWLSIYYDILFLIRTIFFCWTDRPTDRKTDRQTLWFIVKLHFQKAKFVSGPTTYSRPPPLLAVPILITTFLSMQYCCRCILNKPLFIVFISYYKTISVTTL